MGQFSITHLLLIALILLILFGPSRLPQLGQSLGKAIRSFKNGLNEINGEATDISPEKKEQLPHDQSPNHAAQVKTEEEKKKS